MRYKMTVAYDGTDFAGWQVQPKQRTVQGDLEKALHQVFGRLVRVHPSGRTDAGVHALAQIAIFDAPERSLSKLQRSLNGLTADDIGVMTLTVVADDFEPRLWARRKHYRYRWQVGPVLCPLRRRQVRWLNHDFDVQASHQALQCLTGKHDFTSFRAVGCASTHAVRRVNELAVTQHDDEVWLEVQGNGFLRHMVRIIAGCAEAVARGHRPVEWVEHVRDARDRNAAALTLPAKGLSLQRTEYGDERPLWHQMPCRPGEPNRTLVAPDE
ncbi:MAG: tRNA pseudouridine38-40 synthase [Myxococcota bacterium]|jgi:tRNA pseudouridine38-40 synthase